MKIKKIFILMAVLIVLGGNSVLASPKRTKPSFADSAMVAVSQNSKKTVSQTDIDSARNNFESNYGKFFTIAKATAQNGTYYELLEINGKQNAVYLVQLNYGDKKFKVIRITDAIETKGATFVGKDLKIGNNNRIVITYSSYDTGKEIEKGDQYEFIPIELEKSAAIINTDNLKLVRCVDGGKLSNKWYINSTYVYAIGKTQNSKENKLEAAYKLSDGSKDNSVKLVVKNR